MTGLVKPVAVAAAFVFAVWAIGRALDHELSRAGATQAHNSLLVRSASPGVLSERERGGVVAENRVGGGERPRSVVKGDSRTPILIGSRSESASAGGIGTAATYRDGLTKEFGDGLIRVNGHGAEWHRWQRVRAERRVDRLQARLTRRVLEVRELKREVGLLEQLNLDPVLAIRVVFGPWAAEAIRVSSCETGRTFHVGATNGQYLGIFQMGSSERATYGHGPTALEQARAAYRYFAASGRDWSPWECKP